MTRSFGRAHAMVLGAIVSVQVGGALAAQLIGDVGGGLAAALRLTIAAALLWLVVRPRLRGLSGHAWRSAIALGVSLGCMNWSFYLSLKYLPIGVAVTIEFLGPLLLAAAMSRTLWHAVAVGGAATGVLLLSGALTQPLGSLPWVGIVCAAVAGACWALYIVATERAGRQFADFSGLTIAMAVAAAVTLPAGLHGFTRVQLPMREWWMAVGVAGAVAVLSSIIPYALEFQALRTLSARVFGVFLSLEPGMAALAGFVILQQRLTPLQLLGIGCVTVAVLVSQRGEQVRAAAAPPPL